MSSPPVDRLLKQLRTVLDTPEGRPGYVSLPDADPLVVVARLSEALGHLADSALSPGQSFIAEGRLMTLLSMAAAAAVAWDVRRNPRGAEPSAAVAPPLPRAPSQPVVYAIMARGAGGNPANADTYEGVAGPTPDIKELLSYPDAMLPWSAREIILIGDDPDVPGQTKVYFTFHRGVGWKPVPPNAGSAAKSASEELF